MKKKIGIILIILLEIILFFIELKFLGSTFSVDRFLILSFIVLFMCLHLIFDINKMYDFIYKKRYIIGLILLLVVTIRGYHGSSMGGWNKFIQPNYDVDNGGLLIGILRYIRGDEYIVSTPHVLSQTYNNFSSMSNILMGKNSLVTLFPMLPSYNISSVCSIFNIPFLILPFENAFALSWYGKIFLMFFVNFEFFMLITKKNKLYSLLGAILIVFSPVNSWWSIMPILIWGPLVILLFNLYLKTEVKWQKLIYTVLISIIGLNYIMLMYPAWQVPFGYVYLCFVIWLLYENKSKLNYKDLIYLIISILLMGIIIFIVFNDSYEIFKLTTSTVYPGSRLILGGYGFNRLFHYFVNIFFPCIPFYNPSEFSDFISLYPVPLLISVFIILNQIKNKVKTKDIILILLTVTGLLLSIWHFVKIPEILLRISLLSFSVPERSSIVIGYISIILLIRIMSLYSKEKLNKKNVLVSLIISILIIVLGLYFVNITFKDFLNIYMNIIIVIVFLPILFLLLLNNKKSNKYLIIILILLSLFAGATINPISKGTDILTDKPVAKEIRKIVNKDSDSKWITIDSHYSISNYLIANGASTINSTSFYPNMELWHSIDKERKYEDIYNRYAHVLVSLTEGETTFELIVTDTFKVNLNINDLKNMGVDYVVSQKNMDETIAKYFNLLYNEDGVFIYEWRK